MRIVIAGASGFVGQKLCESLGAKHELVGLSRRASSRHQAGVKEWRQCDLNSLKEAEDGLIGADIAIYLVHSMLPRAELVQGNFEDLDLIAADNFARAAKYHGVKRIIYLSGLMPDSEDNLSPHLRSRREVEETLGSHGVPVTILRAGIIVGTEGSSFQIMYRLVKRLPLMICPEWTMTQCQPIWVGDVVECLQYCAEHDETAAQTFNVGGHDVLSYQEMMLRIAYRINRPVRILSFRFMQARLSRFWITVVTGAPRDLVSPLIDSLRHPMIAGELKLQNKMGQRPLSYSEMINRALLNRDTLPTPQAFKRHSHRWDAKKVQSVQRMHLPRGATASWVSASYILWLPRFLKHILHVDVSPEGKCVFYLFSRSWVLLILELSHDRSHEDRPIFYIRGGFLDKGSAKARFEFREVMGGEWVLAAIHDFEPKLPWFIYLMTQAKVHLYVMDQFAQFLAKSKVRV